VAQPCRTFQHAHDTAPANSEIEVIDPAGYGPLNITKGISIQGHGFAGIFQGAGGTNAITVNVNTSDPVTLNGLLIDGGGAAGNFGIRILAGTSVQILNSAIRHFFFGIYDQTTTNSNLLVEDTLVSDNGSTAIEVNPSGGTISATLNRITANNNQIGAATIGSNANMTIANSVMSNNSNSGLNSTGAVWLAKSVISGNATGVTVGGIVKSYGDNYINNNTTPVSGSLTPVGMQ
jgi:hypothetical protein